MVAFTVSKSFSESPSAVVRLGVPSKGRLCQPALRLLNDAGFDVPVDYSQRTLSLMCSNFPLELFFVRAEDIPSFVQSGAFDFGITGFDLLREKNASSVDVEEDLKFAGCRLSLAVPAKSSVRRLEDLEGLRVATSFPGITRGFFSSLGVQVELVELNGAVENACRLNAADAVVDLVASGTTLRSNNLRVVSVLLESTARLVKRNDFEYGSSSLQADFVSALKSVVQGRFRKLVTANAPVDCVGKIRGMLPSLSSPTVSPLLQQGMVSIQMVVDGRDLSCLVRDLKKSGASGIIVSSVDRLVL